jgi:orotidine-5'-phosphate decarboxylase
VKSRERLVFALDVPNRSEAERLLDRLAPHVGVAKIGLELFVAEGPSVVRMASERGLPVFLDLKLHDIPETVERAVARAMDLGVRFLTVHASGGPKMLERAVARTRDSATQIVAVTVLTSLDAADLTAAGVARSPEDQAKLLAGAAASAGVGAFVCSPREAGALRAMLGQMATLITPGVRPRGVDPSDQKRVATVEEAIRAGADYVVVGRPIRDAASPPAVAGAIIHEIAAAIGERS